MKFKDELKLIFRKPWKFVIMLVISTIILFSFLLMVFNFLASRNNLAKMKDNYAQISTIAIAKPSRDGKPLEYTEIDKDLIDEINRSTLVDKVEIRDTMAARIPGVNNTNITFGSAASNAIAVFKGKVEEITDRQDLGPTEGIGAIVSIEKIIAAKDSWLREGESVTLSINMSKDARIKLNNDKSYVFMGVSEPTSLGYMRQYLLVSRISETLMIEEGNSEELTYLYTKGVLEDEEDLEKDFISLLKNEIKNQDDLYTLRLVSDMNMVLPVANENMFLLEGRRISEDDFGKDLCLISTDLAKKHNFKLGDKIDMELSSDIYKSYNGYVSAFPSLLNEGKYDFDEARVFEVAGIYDFSDLNIENSPMLFSLNDIFIPKFKEELNTSFVTPHNLSLKIGVDNIASFEEELLPEIENAGYKVVSADNNWSKVESSFDLIKKSMVKNLIYGFAIGIVGIFILVFVNTTLNKNEYVLRRIFAGDKNHINQSLKVTLMLALCIGLVIALGSIFGFADKLLSNKDMILIFNEIDYLILLLAGLVFLAIALIINQKRIKKLEKKDIVELMQ